MKKHTKVVSNSTKTETKIEQQVAVEPIGSSALENIERMLNAQKLEPHELLGSNITSEELREKLLLIEMNALKHTGKLETIIERYKKQLKIQTLQNRSTDKILTYLKSKKPAEKKE